jgi:hypothetical protein
VGIKGHIPTLGVGKLYNKALYVLPTASENLVSVGQLCDEGKIVIFDSTQGEKRNFADENESYMRVGTSFESDP